MSAQEKFLRGAKGNEKHSKQAVPCVPETALGELENLCCEVLGIKK